MRLSQQHATTPVNLSTDAPGLFQFASDGRPNFAPTLTLTPAETGTYVHVRYAPVKSGYHTGQLFIESPYASLTVELTGRSNGLVPALRRVAATDPLLTDSPLLPARRWLGIATVLLVGGLVYGGYAYRCTLFPALCQTDAVTVPERTPARLPSAEPMVTRTKATPKAAGNRPVAKPERSRMEQQPADPAEERVTRQADKRLSTRAPLTQAPTGPVTSGSDRSETSSERPAQVRRPNERVSTPAPTEAKRRQPIPSSPQATEESELERELNKKIPRQ